MGSLIFSGMFFMEQLHSTRHDFALTEKSKRNSKQLGRGFQFKLKHSGER